MLDHLVMAKSMESHENGIGGRGSTEQPRFPILPDGPSAVVVLFESEGEFHVRRLARWPLTDGFNRARMLTWPCRTRQHCTAG